MSRRIMSRRYLPITTRFLGALALVCLASLIAIAAEKGFGGKWKGEIVSPAGPRGQGGAGARGVPGNQFTQGRGFPGGFGGVGGGGPQKVTLNIKTKDKDTKASGNITVGTTTEDINEGKIEGTIITFRSGRAPGIYQYRGELAGDEIRMTRSPANGGPGQPVEFVLKRS